MAKLRLAKLTSKNQITLPKEIVSHYPDAGYFEVKDSGTAIILSPIRVPSEEQRQRAEKHLEEIREHTSRLGITEKDVADAVRWARGQSPE